MLWHTACGGGEFEVRDGHVNFPIRLATRSCACGKWQICEILCKHALRVIYDQRLNPYDYISPWFKAAAYKLTYAEHIHPMTDPTLWPNFGLPTIQPSIIKRPAGRPAKKRKRGANEPRKGRGTPMSNLKSAESLVTTQEHVESAESLATRSSTSKRGAVGAVHQRGDQTHGSGQRQLLDHPENIFLWIVGAQS